MKHWSSALRPATALASVLVASGAAFVALSYCAGESALEREVVRLGGRVTYRESGLLRHWGGLHLIDFTGRALSDDALMSLWSYGHALDPVQVISLEGTQVTDSTVGQLRAMNGLVRLHLGGTDVRGETLPELRNLQHLTYLSLSAAPVSKKGLSELARLTGLQHLDLSRTLVSNEDMRQIASIPSLAVIDISDSPIDDRGAEILANSPTLETAIAYRTQISARAAARLVERNAKLRILGAGE